MQNRHKNSTENNAEDKDVLRVASIHQYHTARKINENLASVEVCGAVISLGFCI